MSRLLKNSVAAERQRGLVFSETFENTAAVVANGGTITGTPVINNGVLFDGGDYITLSPFPRVIDDATGSFIIKCSPEARTTNSGALFGYGGGAGDVTLFYVMALYVSATTFSIRVNSGYVGSSNTVTTTATFEWGKEYTIGVTSNGSTILIYVNGVVQATTGTNSGKWFSSSSATIVDRKQFIGTRWYSGGTGPDIYTGSISVLKYFSKQVLTAQEVLDYYNNSTFNYMNKAVLDLPMKLEDHDPTGVQTLDRSGNGNDAEFGDGSTGTTYPTKLTKRGYSFDGGDYITVEDDSSMKPTSTLTLCSAFKYDVDAFDNSFATLIGSQNSSYGYWLGILGVGRAYIYLAGVANNFTTLSQGKIIQGTHNTLVATYDSAGGTDNVRVYVNGEFIKAWTETGTIDYSSVTDFEIGYNAQDYSFTGDIFETLVFDKTLTPIQVHDLHNRIMKQIQDT